MIKIDKKFDIKTNYGLFNVILTNHLFKRRNINNKEEKQYRAYMFKTRGQYEDILNFAFNNYGLNDFINKGKVVLVFKSWGNDYALLITLERECEKVATITVITLDKIEKRHYQAHFIFGKELNRIYMKYILPTSYISSIATYQTSMRKKYKFYHSHYFENIVSRNIFHNVNIRRLHEFIADWHINHKLDFGIYWLEYKVNNKMRYIRISIEKIKIENTLEVAIIFIDMKENILAAQKRADALKEKIIHLGEEKIDFGILEKKHSIVSHGLKITKKKNITPKVHEL